MVDIHSHILPEVDDGSRSVEQSLSMLETAVSKGVTDIVCTPHYRWQYNLSQENVKEKFDKFVSAVKGKNIPVRLYLGREVYELRGLSRIIRENPDMIMNGKPYVLGEFDFYEKKDPANSAYELKKSGYTLIVAHAERYNYLTLEDIYEIKRNGGLIQVNAQSVTKRFKKFFGRRVKDMFSEGLVDFVASDIHFDRENAMAEAYQYINKKFGEKTARAVFTENARQIIED